MSDSIKKDAPSACKQNKDIPKQPRNNSSSIELELIPTEELMMQSLDVNWLIKDYLTADSTAMLFGAPSTAKSLIALELAYCIGTGINWHGHDVSQGSVVYVAGEGFNGLNKRLKALEIHCSHKPVNLHFSNQSIDLHNAESVNKLLGIITPIKDVKLIIIDTLHRNFTGDENSSRDFAIVMQHCDRLRAATSACILLVHHSGHGSSERSRGTSSINAALDIEYKITKTNNTVTLHNSKSKDIEIPEDMEFDLKIIDIGKSSDAKQMTAPVLSRLDTNSTKHNCSSKDVAIFKKLESLLSIDGVPISANDQFYTGNHELVAQTNPKKLCKDELYKKCADDIAIKSKNPDASQSSNSNASKRKSYKRSIDSLIKSNMVAANDEYITIPASTDDDEGKT